MTDPHGIVIIERQRGRSIAECSCQWAASFLTEAAARIGWLEHAGASLHGKRDTSGPNL